MYQIFNRVNTFDNSPFQYARMDYLKSRVDENYQRLVSARKTSTGRLDSSHLLMKILGSLTVKFTGDLVRYMDQVEDASKSLCSSLGITASFNKGRVFTDSGFYPGCPEIVIYARNPKWSVMHLWRDWRSVTPIEILTHPITEMDIVELGVKNEMSIQRPALSIIQIDIPLLAAQWKMWQAAFPDRTMEEYLTTIPLVGAVKSHLNVCLFNKLQVFLGIRPECQVKTNLVFMQTPVDNHVKEIVDDVIKKVGAKSLTPNQALASIPVVYGNNYLDDVVMPSMTPTYQVMWALIAQKMEPAAVCLELAKFTGYDRMLKELTVIRRTLISNKEEKTLVNGLTSAASELLESRMESLVTSRLPT